MKRVLLYIDDKQEEAMFSLFLILTHTIMSRDSYVWKNKVILHLQLAETVSGRAGKSTACGQSHQMQRMQMTCLGCNIMVFIIRV